MTKRRLTEEQLRVLEEKGSSWNTAVVRRGMKTGQWMFLLDLDVYGVYIPWEDLQLFLDLLYYHDSEDRDRERVEERANRFLTQLEELGIIPSEDDGDCQRRIIPGRRPEKED